MCDVETARTEKVKRTQNHPEQCDRSFCISALSSTGWVPSATSAHFPTLTLTCFRRSAMAGFWNVPPHCTWFWVQFRRAKMGSPCARVLHVVRHWFGLSNTFGVLQKVAFVHQLISGPYLDRNAFKGFLCLEEDFVWVPHVSLLGLQVLPLLTTRPNPPRSPGSSFHVLRYLHPPLMCNVWKWGASNRWTY